jgi:transketolase
MLSEAKTRELGEKARILRKNVMEMLYQAQSGHPGGSLSLADIMSVLYFHDLKYNPEAPKDPDRDRVVLSKGHAAPIWYATLAEAGFFPVEELGLLRRTGALLQGHPCMHIPGVDLTTGSLGLGLSGACGMAFGARMTHRDHVRVYAIIGDGELGEGQIWEAALAAGHFGLDNLTAIIDCNRYQNDGATADILSTEPLFEKWSSFGWNTLEIDGHNIPQIASAFELARNTRGKPTMIIANTVKGQGVSYLIDRPELHYAAPNEEQKEMALRDLGF